MNKKNILTINGGSSSIKFALYKIDEPLKRILYGKVDRIGLQGTNLTYKSLTRNEQGSLAIEASSHKSAIDFLIGWLENQVDFSMIDGIGHRMVFGMKHTKPEIITKDLLSELHSISQYDQNHLSAELELIELLKKRFPAMYQVACFDTEFHSRMPRVAKLLPIPRRFDLEGIQRYGFHGISYSYLMGEIAHLDDTKAANGRVILAHLGNGASVAAVNEGKSIDTSMGFTPASGLTMSSRSGDLDPGVAWYIMKSENLTPEQFNNLINYESGLIGISETSSDMRDLLSKEAEDVRAAEAVELFCYQTKKWIGAYAAVLGGLDTLVFAGGIGENCPVVRSRICEGLEFLGIKLEEKRNNANAPVISEDTAKVVVRVIHTDEELMIAKTVRQILKLNYEMEHKHENKKSI